MSPKNLIEFVANYNNLTYLEIAGTRGTTFIQTIRAEVIFLLKKFFPHSSDSDIGGWLMRDRSTICGDRTSAENLYEVDSSFSLMVDHMEKLVRKNILDMELEESIPFSISMMLKKLFHEGILINTDRWQAKRVDVKMKEITHYYFKTPIPLYVDKLQILCNPDLPWAENHFQERVKGHGNFNPGKEYQNWPYYKPGSFLEVQDSKFSHTYMERFWPTYAGTPMVEEGYEYEGGDEMQYRNQGIRYTYGDYLDIVDRLIQDNGTRQAYLSIWHPEDQSNDITRRLPCSLGYYFLIRNGKLNLTYHIRSCDAIRHLKNDIYMACRLAQHTVNLVNADIDQKEKITVGVLDMWIGSLHCFESDLYTLKKLIR